MPIAIKDDTDVAGEVTAYGSGGHGPPLTSDSEVVHRLRAAGAVIIGKTNVPELMMMPLLLSLAREWRDVQAWAEQEVEKTGQAGPVRPLRPSWRTWMALRVADVLIGAGQAMHARTQPLSR